jgi:integrase
VSEEDPADQLTAASDAVEMAREAVPLNVIQRQLGHADLGVTSVYLQGIDNTEVVGTVNARRAPTMPASAGLLM